jgi:hypothetical protein
MDCFEPSSLNSEIDFVAIQVLAIGGYIIRGEICGLLVFLALAAFVLRGRTGKLRLKANLIPATH